MNRILNIIKDFFKSKSYGYYFALGAAALCLVTVILYATGFGAEFPDYYDSTPVWLPVVGVIAFLGLSVSRYTAKYAPAVMGVFVFAAMLLYADAVYMYLTEVFYSGVNDETLEMLSPKFVACTVMYVLSAVACNVAIWLRQLRKPAGAPVPAAA